jgi:hypothetical protein
MLQTVETRQVDDGRRPAISRIACMADIRPGLHHVSFVPGAITWRDGCAACHAGIEPVRPPDAQMRIDPEQP